MTITEDGTFGFSEPGVKAPLVDKPGIGFESRSGAFHFIPSIAPWGCVLPMEVLNGAPLFVDSLRVVVWPNETEFYLKDMVRVQLQALDGSVEGYYSLPQEVVDFNALHFAVLDCAARRFEGKEVEVIFVIERDGSSIPSPSQYVTFAPALVQTGQAAINEVDEGALNIDQHPNGVTLIIPQIENLRTNNAIEFYLSISPDGGSNGAWGDYQRKLTVKPHSDLEFFIEPEVYQGHRGKSVYLSCTLYLGTGMVPGLRYGMGPRGTLNFKLE